MQELVWSIHRGQTSILAEEEDRPAFEASCKATTQQNAFKKASNKVRDE
jgi:hypothetical protein